MASVVVGSLAGKYRNVEVASVVVGSSAGKYRNVEVATFEFLMVYDMFDDIIFIRYSSILSYNIMFTIFHFAIWQ